MPISYDLNHYQENEWSSFQCHMEWADGFSLIFLFSSQPALVNTFRTRLDDIFMMRAAKMEYYKPDSPDFIINDVMSLVRKPLELHEGMLAPLWIELNYGTGSEWDKARKNLIERLNEHRELLRKNINRPVVIILPGNIASGLKEMAPDLWSIRSYSLNLDIIESVKTGQSLKDKNYLSGSDNSRDNNVIYTNETPLNLSHIREWERLQQSGKTGSNVIHAGRNAFDAAMEAGQIQRASEIAEQTLKLARKNITELKEGNNLNRLYELSMTLNNVGDSKMALNVPKEAETLYKESLDIRRKILTIAGESPQVLRDLNYSLERVGDVEKESGMLQEARKTYGKALAISERLCHVFPGNDQYKKDMKRVKAKIEEK